MSQPRFGSVDEALAGVRREVPPTRDLWSGIAQELGERSDRVAGKPTDLATVRAARGARAVRVAWPLTLAASLSMVSLVGALCWSVIHQRSASELSAINMSPAIAGNALVSFGPPHNGAYLAAHAELERTFNERIVLLAPATRIRVQADLEIIRHANDDLRAALARDPASPLLLQLLHSTGQQEIDLYTSVAQATAPLLMRRT